ncbi:twin-arginine translocase TatA/TatE family subunit [Sphingobium sufflavum]|uniref:twin-arginine translocase TatA/TatE family subunit n=1 Tax=Sphingobium sufflavum TaxID=1129547 RepID=UPI001F32C370|nr:twin-arginine translocase TatA/TatE family subunit [Sphingobium sufflavum]MCE7795859.1 twin-arginine translocase TatA/TatE family subunit [Sphingobium sufflavum]
MGFGSPLHWIVLVLVVVLLFGGGRISGLMGDVAKGIKSFKKGMADDDDDVTPQRQAQPVQQIEAKAEQAPQPTAAPVSSEQKQG